MGKQRNSKKTRKTQKPASAPKTSTPNKTQNPTPAQKPRAPSRDLDGRCKECFGSPARICDLLNNTLLRELDKYPLDPNDIEILDPTMVNANGKNVRKRYLDTLVAVFWPGTPHILANLRCVFDIEYQTAVHFGMVQRHGDYTSCEYRRQYEALKDVEYQAAIAQWKVDAAAAQANGDNIPARPKRRQADASYDLLASCIPVTFHLGATPWTAALTIDDVTKPDPGRGYGDLKSPSQYHLIDPCTIPDDVFPLFSTDVGLLLKVLKYQNDRDKLEQFSQDPDFLDVDGAVARFIDTVTNMGLGKVIDMEGETVNMCMGLQLLVDDGVNRGVDIGIDRGQQRAYDILNELTAGTPEAEICTKLGVTKKDVRKAKAVFNRIRNTKFVPVSP